MGLVTLQVIDGADRGRVFDGLATPVTVGREEGNSIQLSDERVSRFHFKIQEDHDKYVLTDLDSTNGTKVNGEELQLRILRFGDLISVGRSQLLFGSREQIAQRFADLRVGSGPEPTGLDAGQPSLDYELYWSAQPDPEDPLHVPVAPELPDRLSPLQAAQLSDLMSYFHIRLRHLVGMVTVEKDADVVTLDSRQWQNVLDLQMRLAEYLRRVSEPPPEGEG